MDADRDSAEVVALVTAVSQGNANGQQGSQSEEGPRAAPQDDQEAERAHSQRNNVPNWKVGDDDGCGRRIFAIYFKRCNYIIYCTQQGDEKQVMVRYSDEDKQANDQIASIAVLIALRNHLQFLLLDVRGQRKERYYSQIAEAFRLGLEGKAEIAKQAMDAAVQEVQSIRSSNGRNVYVRRAAPYAAGAALICVLIAALVLKLANAPFGNAWHPIGYLLLTAAAGAVGAVLSIALSVRARTVATDGDSSSISMDALLRVSIGIISAGVLYLVLNTGVIAQLRIGDLAFKPGAVAWQLALLAGFAAGFLERLVPDLLEKKAA